MQRCGGREAANLGDMTRMGLPVPKGFAISIEVYRKSILDSGAADQEAKRYQRTEEKHKLVV